MKQENTSTSSYGQQLFRRRPCQGSYRLFHPDRIDKIPRDKIRKKQKSAVLRYHSQQECGSARTGSRSKSSVLIRRVFHLFGPARQKAAAIQRSNAVRGARHRECFLIGPFDGMYCFSVTAEGKRRSPSTLQFPKAYGLIQ